MSNAFKDLQGNWESNKKSLDFPTSNLDQLYKKIKNKQKENFLFYYGTLTILTITLITISLFFYYTAPVQRLLSRVGAGLMIFGLLFRIIIEIISLFKAKQIDPLDNTLKTTEHLIKFHQFRKSIHQVVAPIIIGLYTLGFFMITPEFSEHMPLWNIILIDVSYVVIGIILFIVIKKGVVKEMRKLSEIVALKNELTE